MHDSLIRKTKRMAVGIISILMLAVLLFSVFYPVVETRHECKGDHCEICACIRQCAELLRQAGEILLAGIVFPLNSVVLCIVFFFLVESVSRKTPVADRVRLNN